MITPKDIRDLCIDPDDPSNNAIDWRVIEAYQRGRGEQNLMRAVFIAAIFIILLLYMACALH